MHTKLTTRFRSILNGGIHIQIVSCFRLLFFSGWDARGERRTVMMCVRRLCGELSVYYLLDTLFCAFVSTNTYPNPTPKNSNQF